MSRLCKDIRALVGVRRVTIVFDRGGWRPKLFQGVAVEPLVENFDAEAERAQRAVGRPSKAEPFRSFLIGELAAQPDVLSLELLRRQAQGLQQRQERAVRAGQGAAAQAI